MLPFKFIQPAAPRVPVLVSIPHCGVQFPDEIKGDYNQKLIQAPEDTDWFVDQLYDFAPSLGMTMISAVHSRWVIDLNRDPESKPLYTDGRIITGLCPTTTFLGEALYHDRRDEVEKTEVERRLRAYYWPYHQKIKETLADLRSEFGRVLLWDCHSIRQVVPTIQPDKFPDLILGNADKTSASPALIDIALNNLGSGGYSLSHNHPFKGGFITRYYGKPSEEVHALQLEMTKVNYMDDQQKDYDVRRAEKVREILKKTFAALIKNLSDRNS